MPVLITGGSGFVGLNIAEALLGRGETVVLFCLAEPPATAAPLTQLPGRLLVEIGDVRNGNSLDEVIRRHNVDRIIHGAAITADVHRERKEARTIAEVNLGGTIEILEAASRAKMGRIVQLSTGSIFASSGANAEPLDEVRDAPVPETLYGITKYAAERTGLRYRATRGLDLVVARLGMVFGRWEYETGVRDTMSMPLQLFRMAERGACARFCRDLPNDWIYSSDVARAILLLLDAPSIAQAVYHVSSGSPWSVSGWCNRLREVYPAFSYQVIERRADANIGESAPPPRPPFSTARLRNDFGFSPHFDEAKAFADFIAWQRDASH